MSKVDWSKAPEGATHWMPESRYWQEGFWKREGEANYFFVCGEWACSGARPFGHPAMVKRPATPQWNGEGLPPVGASVEWFSPVYGWLGGRVVGHDGAVAVISHSDGYTGCHLHEVRPIRTPEQLAAEARERAIRDMVFGACGCEPDGGNTSVFILCELLYDAGYRKLEQPE